MAALISADGASLITNCPHRPSLQEGGRGLSGLQPREGPARAFQIQLNRAAVCLSHSSGASTWSIEAAKRMAGHCASWLRRSCVQPRPQGEERSGVEGEGVEGLLLALGERHSTTAAMGTEAQQGGPFPLPPSPLLPPRGAVHRRSRITEQTKLHTCDSGSRRAGPSMLCRTT